MKVKLDYMLKSGGLITVQLPAYVALDENGETYLAVNEEVLTNNQKRFYELYREQESGFLSIYDSWRQSWGFD